MSWNYGDEGSVSERLEEVCSINVLFTFVKKMRKNKTEILKSLAPLKIWAGDKILAPTYMGSMTRPMRERQSQAAPVAQQARQALAIQD